MTRSKPVATAKPKPTDVVLVAIEAAKAKGHTTMRPSNRTVACWRCPLDGVVGPEGVQIGSIFTEECNPK